jgi:heme/copper-type cytochrome/quinol oxidase subunit 2
MSDKLYKFFGSDESAMYRMRIVVTLIIIRVMLVIVMVTILIHAFKEKGDAADTLFRWSGLVGATLAALAIPELIFGGFERHYSASSKTTIKTVTRSSNPNNISDMHNHPALLIGSTGHF